MADEFLSLDDIEQSKNVDYVVVPCPEWGGSLRLGSINAEAQSLFLEMIEQDVTATQDAVWNLLVQCLVDGQGNRLVRTNEDRKRVIAILKKKDVRVTDRIISAMYDLIGLRTSRSAPKNDSSEEAPASSPTPLPEAVAV